MNITTEYKTNPTSGAGKIVAKGNGRQLTLPYDHSISAGRNHGRAAAALANKMWTADEQRVVFAKPGHEDLGHGKHRFFSQ